MINTYNMSKQDKEILSKAYFAVLKNLELTDWFDADISVIGRESIRSLNLEHRGVDRVTDVLSFPSVEIKWPICPCSYKGEVDPDTGNLFLGDIMICKSKIREQAKEFGHSELRELVYLFVHGMLHLFGFDHIEKDDEEEMLEHQKAIMEDLGISR